MKWTLEHAPIKYAEPEACEENADDMIKQGSDRSLEPNPFEPPTAVWATSRLGGSRVAVSLAVGLVVAILYLVFPAAYLLKPYLVLPDAILVGFVAGVGTYVVYALARFAIRRVCRGDELN